MKPGVHARGEAHGRLPNFADLGGMDGLKTQLHDTVGTLLACGGAADRCRVSLGGLLLYGPPGAGKTFAARAAASPPVLEPRRRR